MISAALTSAATTTTSTAAGTANIVNSAFINPIESTPHLQPLAQKLCPADCSDVARGSEKRVRLAG
jgi:hypothetical protein